MTTSNFNARTPWRRSVSRRRLLKYSGVAGAGLAGSPMLGCSNRAKPAPSTSSQGSAPASQQTPKSGGTVNTYLTYNPPLDPQKVSAGAQQVVSGVMSRLFRFKTGPGNVFVDHDLENDLGLSAESPDAITWTVKMHPDAKFHNTAPVNGHPVTSEDVKATFTRAVDPATSNPNRGSLNMIDVSQIQTPAPDTVVFKLNYPYAPFQRTLASPSYSWIFPREVLTGGYVPAKQVIGSGPFTLDSVTPDVAYVYKKNPAYFEQGRPYVDVLKVAVIHDQTQQQAQFAAGNLDELLLFSPFDVAAAQKANPKAVVEKVSDGRPFPIYLQLGDPSSPFQDLRVRQAVSMALDREAIGKAIYNGEYIPTLFVPAYMGKWAIQEKDLDASTAQYYKYNPAEAKKLLEAAGASNMQLDFAYIVNSAFTTPVYVKGAETVSNMLNAAGIKTTITTQDYNKDYIDAGHGSRQGYFDKNTVIFSGLASYTEADEFLFANFHSKSTSNDERVSDPTLDAMIDKERTIIDENERLKAVLEIEKYIAGKVYVVPTPGGFEYPIVQPRVQNYGFTNGLGGWCFLCGSAGGWGWPVAARDESG